MQNRAVWSARWAHNPEVTGSNPVFASLYCMITKSYVSFHSWNKFYDSCVNINTNVQRCNFYSF